MQNDPQTRVSAPAVGLIVTGALGAALGLLGVLMMTIGGVAALAGKDAADALPGLGVSLVFSVIGIAVSGFVAYAGMQMRKLQGWGLSLAGAIVAMIPCISPCCILGLPIGIWAILVLINEDIKRAFGAGGGGMPPGGYGPPPGGYGPPPGEYGPPPGSPGGYGPAPGGPPPGGPPPPPPGGETPPPPPPWDQPRPPTA